MHSVVVVGTGRMGQNHARVLHELGVLAGVVDEDKPVRETVAKRLSTRAYGSLDDIRPSAYDAAVVATPTGTHFEIAAKILNRGKHVLVEKPLCATSAQAERLTRVARQNRRILAVGHIERHNPAVRYAKKGLDSGEFGEPIAMSSKRVSSDPTRIQDVGVVIDLAIHDIDVIRYLVGSKVKRVAAVGGQFVKRPGGHEDHASILLEFASGTTAHIEVNWLTPYKVRTLTMTCSKKLVGVDYINQTVELSTSTLREVDPSDMSQLPLEYGSNLISLRKQEPLRLESEDFLTAIERNAKPLVPGEEGVANLRICERVLAALRSGAR